MSLTTTVETFFDAYRRQDTDAMLACFSDGGTIHYIPAGLEGPARQQGVAIWTGLIDVFPDLTNRIMALYVGDDGRSVTVEVMISGTQAKDGFGIPNLGKRYEVPHAFIITGSPDGGIDRMTAYWDNAAWFTMLGKTTLA
ncbi:MAG: nuclear transport factor 2 family protein [Gluconacetobacter sp.]|uniref:Nuclear transport factor 2 family protein n=1 Tax=Gluconacetobacter dulcium TaxID=2729096 RepID=A0A7W4PJB7_9PROT|nr:nuclear transport factor 2 family protein [Gluconacetobacter dulcium]MBB2199583.1 nuclear transport factor 2 family protein [Gluconacetobacter dulcium]